MANLLGDARPPPVWSWRELLRPPALWVLALLILTAPLVLPYLRGDGVGYYAWLRSPFMDADLQFENEFRRGDPGFHAMAFDEMGEIRDVLRTPTGHVRNQWSVGPALLWTPFFGGGHIVAVLGGAVGAGWTADGFSFPYLWVTALGTSLYGAMAILLAYRLARTFCRPATAIVGTVAVWGASSLVVYQYLLPFKAMVLGAFVGAVLLTVWRFGSWDLSHWFLMGVLSGLVSIVHPVGLTWVVLPVAGLIGLDPGGRLGQRARAAAVFVLGGLLGLVPQLLGKAIVHGSPFDMGYDTEWRLLQPDVVGVLFGADHGLIAWTPVAGLALVGLVIVSRRYDRRLGIGLLAVFAAMLYMVAAYATPELSSYGNRFFVILTPGLVVGAAALAEAVWDRARIVVLVIVPLLIAWNALFAFQWAWGMIPKRAAVDWSEVVRNQFTRAPQELTRAVGLFFTDRAELIRLVQSKDLENIRQGEDVAGVGLG
jgi:hypothetical protein